MLKKSLMMMLLVVGLLTGCQQVEHVVEDLLGPAMEKAPVAEHESTVKPEDVKEARQEAQKKARQQENAEAPQRPDNGPAERALVAMDGSPLANSLAYLQFGLVDALGHFHAFYPDAGVIELTLAPDDAGQYLYHILGQDDKEQAAMTLNAETGEAVRHAEAIQEPAEATLSQPPAQLNQQLKACLEKMVDANGRTYTRLEFKIFTEAGTPQVEITLSKPASKEKDQPEEICRRYALKTGELLEEVAEDTKEADTPEKEADAPEKEAEE